MNKKYNPFTIFKKNIWVYDNIYFIRIWSNKFYIEYVLET